MNWFVVSLLLIAPGCSMPAEHVDRPSPDAPWVIRTFDSDDQRWLDLQKAIWAPYSRNRFLADVRFIDDPKFYDHDAYAVVAALPDNYPSGFCFVAGASSDSQGNPLIELVYFFPDSDDTADYERAPREAPIEDIQVVTAIPKAVQELENNLSISNIDMDDVLNCLSDDGIFRPSVPE